MSLIWTLIATFLYVEIGIVLLFVLPIASPQRWQRFFRSRFLAMLSRQAQVYFYLLLGVLILFLLEAIREMRKYSLSDISPESGLNVGMQHSMRLFRAQRNFYISGFAIFLTLVIRRLVILISNLATLLTQSEASMRQAQNATCAARTLISHQKNAEAAEQKADNIMGTEEEKRTVDELKQKITDLNNELLRERDDKETLKLQSDTLSKEYDRLMDKYCKLEKLVKFSTNSKNSIKYE